MSNHRLLLNNLSPKNKTINSTSSPRGKNTDNLTNNNPKEFFKSQYSKLFYIPYEYRNHSVKLPLSKLITFDDEKTKEDQGATHKAYTSNNYNSPSNRKTSWTQSMDLVLSEKNESDICNGINKNKNDIEPSKREQKHIIISKLSKLNLKSRETVSKYTTLSDVFRNVYKISNGTSLNKSKNLSNADNLNNKNDQQLQHQQTFSFSRPFSANNFKISSPKSALNNLPSNNKIIKACNPDPKLTQIPIRKSSIVSIHGTSTVPSLTKLPTKPKTELSIISSNSLIACNPNNNNNQISPLSPNNKNNNNRFEIMMMTNQDLLLPSSKLKELGITSLKDIKTVDEKERQRLSQFISSKKVRDVIQFKTLHVDEIPEVKRKFDDHEEIVYKENLKQDFRKIFKEFQNIENNLAIENLAELQLKQTLIKFEPVFGSKNDQLYNRIYDEPNLGKTVSLGKKEKFFGDVKSNKNPNNFTKVADFKLMQPTQKQLKIIKLEMKKKSKERIRSKITILRQILDYFDYMKTLKLTIEDLMKDNVFSTRPFEKDGSYTFIQAAKNGKFDLVKNFLIHNRCLIYEYDEGHRTALHWAAIRGNINLVGLLIKNGADINFRDLYSKRAIFYAVKGGHKEIVRLLLVNKADPWSTDDQVYYKITNDEDIIEVLKRARQISLTLRIISRRKRKEAWVLSQKKFIEDFPGF